MKPRIFVTRKLPDSVMRELNAWADVVCHDATDEPVPRDVLLRQVQGCAGILSLITERIDAEVMDAAGPTLQIVANLAVGYDNIDVAAAKARGVLVTNTPDVLTETTADLTFGLLLAAARRIPEAERTLRAGEWRTWSPMMMTGQDVYGATIGIVGMGRIGAAVARRAKGFGMEICYFNRTRRPAVEAELGARLVPLDELLTTADFVVVLAPLTPETHHLIGRREFELMKPTAVFINTARGPIVDESALVEALRSGQIWAAGLDVFEQEPISPRHPLLQLRNVVLLPHIGSASIQTRLKMAQLAAENLRAALLGGTPPNRVW
ncbi:D-glycerate dehydrogenase [Alicyclobacillus cycloheptanicus]|uniref:Glyoxylate reductase n=1 Tax=Alicyclobacillus cycloheptanicus TaxID=1457 RepID=A0ABT9XJX5_9BACL|nr:D-glycerate dehydrogenase [Alicyclobacillus cycloheptanicus]MDQ0190614.1 glyoxylate reductase [Alicyclobacillus cycloheptanicus]WDM01817.1 D-glycerate dehydrogenase [Alicyclobacillus cycloheptanicus]